MSEFLNHGQINSKMAEKSADRKFCDNRDYGNIHIKLAFGLFIASVAIQGIDSPMAPQYFDLTGFDPTLIRQEYKDF